jgi:hypothetical protein
MSDEDELYIKVIVLDEIYNFVFQTFLIWDRLDVQTSLFEIIYLTKITFDFLNLKFEFFKRPRIEKHPKQKL